MQKRKGTLCWYCKNAIGKCSWSQEGIPVKGWGAEPTIIKCDNGTIISSYCVKSCPLFIQEQEVKHKTVKEIAAELGFSIRTVYRKKLNKIKEVKNE